MAEFNFEEPCKTGIRRDVFVGRNHPAFIKARGHRPTQFGMQQFYPLLQIPSLTYITEDLGETPTWPFPQIFRGNSISLLCFADAIYEIDETNNAVCTLIETKDALDPTGGTTKAITAGLDWHFIDLGPTWMLMNTACVIFKTGWSPYVFVQDSVTVYTGCAHKEGRVLMGGFNSDDFDSLGNWNDFWQNWTGTVPDTVAALATTGAHANWIWWSSFMAADLLHLFWPQILKYQALNSSSNTGYSDESPLILDLAKRNEAGLRPIPGRYSVVGQLPMGDNVINYGMDNISVLRPATFGDSISTYGVLPIENLPQYLGPATGSECRTAFAGDQRGHLFIASDGEAWSIGKDLVAKREGWKNELSNLNFDRVMVVHEPYHEEFYVGDGELAYLINKNGISRAPWMPSRLITLNSSTIAGCIFESTDPDLAEYLTDQFRGDTNDVETLYRIQMVGRNTKAFTVYVDYRMRTQDDWTRTDPFTPDSRGVVTLGVLGLEWRIYATATDRTDCTLEKILVKTSPDFPPALAHWARASSPGSAED